MQLRSSLTASAEQGVMECRPVSSDDIRFLMTCWAVIFVVEEYIYTNSVVVEIGIHYFSSIGANTKPLKGGN